MSRTSDYIQIIRRAKEILRESGWTRNHFTNAAGEHCALGALDEAVADLMNNGKLSTPSRELSLSTLEGLMNDIAIEMSPDASGVIGFNDRVAQSVKDIYRLFDSTLVRIKEGV